MKTVFFTLVLPLIKNDPASMYQAHCVCPSPAHINDHFPSQQKKNSSASFYPLIKERN